MDDSEKLMMDPIKSVKPIQIDANDNTTKYVLQGLFDDRFYSKEVIDEKFSSIENLIESKIKDHKLNISENKNNKYEKLWFTILGAIISFIVTNLPEIIKFFSSK